MTHKEKAKELLKSMNKNEAIRFCNETLHDLGYNDGGAGVEDDDMYNIMQIENFLKIKSELKKS